MATLKIVHFWEMENLVTATSLHQGAATNTPWKPLNITVTGTKHEKAGVTSGATSAALVIYDSNSVGGDDLPATFDHGIYWCDVDSQIQLVDGTNSLNVLHEVTATVPFEFEGTFLPAADATMTTATETLNAVTKIGINTSAAASYILILFD